MTKNACVPAKRATALSVLECEDVSTYVFVLAAT